ncbi:unnamed protein product [Amoebophrya sp. A120]|nr:unnamed protein product [Amoebophrya sp. A120]|eukprot:GSA120T00020514001.1
MTTGAAVKQSEFPSVMSGKRYDEHPLPADQNVVIGRVITTSGLLIDGRAASTGNDKNYSHSTTTTALGSSAHENRKMSSTPTTARRTKEKLYQASLGYAVSFAFFACWVRFLTLYFLSISCSASQIGLLVSSGKLTTMLTGPIGAYLADKSREAKLVLLFSIGFSMLSFAAIPLTVVDASQSFGTLFFLYVTFNILRAPQGSLLDALILEMSEKDRDVWSKSRMWGAISWGATHVVLGFMLSHSNGSFLPMWGGYQLIGLLFLYTGKKLFPKHAGKDSAPVNYDLLTQMVKQRKVFFLNLTMIGGGFSLVEAMLFLALDELNATPLLCGMSVLTTVIFELPIFYYGEYLLETLGAKQMILLGQAAWVFRAIFYAWMPKADYVLLVEPLHGVTFALVFIAAVQETNKLAPDGMKSSAQAVLGFTFGGIGPCVVVFLGGLLFDWIGYKKSFFGFAILVLASMGVYYFAREEENENDVEIGRAIPVAVESAESALEDSNMTSSSRQVVQLEDAQHLHGGSHDFELEVEETIASPAVRERGREEDDVESMTPTNFGKTTSAKKKHQNKLQQQQHLVRTTSSGVKASYQRADSSSPEKELYDNRRGGRTSPGGEGTTSVE